MFIFYYLSSKMVNFLLKKQQIFIPWSKAFHEPHFHFASFQLLAALDSLEKAVDTAQANVTDMASMVPMVEEQFQKNEEQLAITEQNARDAYNQSQIANRVCHCNYVCPKNLTPSSWLLSPHFPSYTRQLSSFLEDSVLCYSQFLSSGGDFSSSIKNWELYFKL